ncbi:MAG TPA: MFS transporter [Candidatus Baltobacteraceae bacterium]|nr:MFS transporter [Candidatus Baltobacteraceae bacterium]
MDVLRTYRALLDNGPLARLLAGEFVSAIGDWLYLVALLILVYERPDASPLLLGVVGAARVLPYVFLSVPAGIVADRYDRRLVLLGTDLARGAIMLLMAALVAVDGPLLAIVGLAILATCFSAFFGPAIGAYLPRLVRDETELGPANSAWASLDSLAFATGPAIGGAIILATGGLTLAFLLNAASFAVVALVLWHLPSSGSHVREGAARAATSPAEAPATPPVADALAPSRALRPVAGLVVISAVGSFVFGGLGVLTVVIATDILREGAAGTGALNAAIGVGGLVGALAAGVLVLRRRLALPLMAGGLAMVAGIAALGLTSSLALAAVALAAACLGSSIVDIVSLTLLQRLVPDTARGRAIGVIETVSIGAYAVGSLVLPVAAAPLGLPLLLGSCAAACLASIAAGIVILGPAAGRESSISPAAARFVALPVFAGLSPARLEAAAMRLRPEHVAAGTVVIRQGDAADRLYFIVDGQCAVAQTAAAGGSAQHLRTMGPDELFGEIGLLTGAPRSATVTATGETDLLMLEGADFLALVGSGPGLTSRLLDLHRGASAAPAH